MAVLKKLNTWFDTCETGPDAYPSFNVFIADYVDLDEDRFAKTIINLNYRMEEQMKRNKLAVYEGEVDDGHHLESVPEEEDDGTI